MSRNPTWRSNPNDPVVVEARNTLRRPQRDRGLRRVEDLLDATEAVLIEFMQEDISLALIAEQARVPLPSVYHFFRNRNAILVALAGRYHRSLRQLARAALDPPPVTWQSMLEVRVRDAVRYLNAHPAALRLFMGAGVSVEVRNLDLGGNTVLAQIRGDDFRRHFHCDHMDGMDHWMAVCMGLMDGVWAISYAEGGTISDDILDDSLLAAFAYLRCFLPEYLKPRD